MASRTRAEARPPLLRIVRMAAGWSLLAVGGALLVLPGPGIPLVLGGLALLSREHRWARRTRAYLRSRWRAARRRKDPGTLPPA
jgi:hypothetical protein